MSNKPRGPFVYHISKGADVVPFSGVASRSSSGTSIPPGAAIPCQPQLAEVVRLNNSRSPVWYDVAVAHHWNGDIQTWVRGVDMDNPANLPKIAIALRQVADAFDPAWEGDAL
jgi:hypothetical protein